MPTNDYRTFLISMLEDKVLLSSEITDALSNKFGITKNYGRKLILKHVRARDIYSSFPLVFKSNQAGYSLIHGNNQYISLLHHKPRLENVYMAFIQNGFISKYHLLKLGGVIDVLKSKYYDLGKVLSDLRYFFPFLKEVIINNETFYHNNIDEEALQIIYNEELETRNFEVQFIPLVLSYANRINLIYKQPHYIRREMPFTGVSLRQNLIFDATAFTGIGNPNKETSVVVFDFKIQGKYLDQDFNGFKYRVETLINSTKGFNQRVIPVIVASEYDNTVYKEIYDENRYMIFTLSNIFGSRFNTFLEMIKTKDINGLKEAQEILEVIESTGHAEQLSRFFPYAFEALISEVLNKIFNHYSYGYEMSRGKIIKNNGISKEYDVWFENDQEILAVECKHYKSLINWEKRNSKGKLENYCAKYFFEDKYQLLKIKGYSKPIKLLFVASSGFTKGAERNISKIDNSLSHEKLKLSMTALELVDFCKNNAIGISDQKDWLKRYFIKDRVIGITDPGIPAVFEPEEISFEPDDTDFYMDDL